MSAARHATETSRPGLKFLARQPTIVPVNVKSMLGPLGLAMALLGTSCGGDSGSCPDMGNCGGDIVGTWKIVTSCFDGLSQAVSSGTSGSCNQETIDASQISISGTMSYKADGTFMQSLKLAGNLKVLIPASCLTVQGITITCAQLNQAASSQASSSGKANSGLGGPLTCSNAGGGACSCSEPLQGSSSNNAGTYSAKDGVLTQTGSSSSNDYCVQGNRLYLQAHQNMSMGSTGQVALGSRMVLEKQ